MKGIPCNTKEFNQLQERIHSELKDKLKDYNADNWADEKRVPKKTSGKLLLPVSKGLRYEIILKILTQSEKDRIIEVLPGDTNWFPESEL